MKTNENIRKSNFELLRIVAMLLIMASHLRWAFLDVDMSSAPLYNRIFENIFISLGQVGVILFILISGYFLCKGGFKITSLLKLWAEVVFYSICFYFFDLSYNNTFDTFSFIKLFREMFVLSYGGYWFIIVYTGLYIVSPFINIIISKLNKKQFLALLEILFFLFVIIPTFQNKMLNQNDLVSNLFYFVFLYMVGAYIRLHSEDFSSWKLELIALALCLTTYIMFTIFYGVYEYRNFILIPIISVIIFSLFNKIKIQSKIINIVASTTFGVYLLHENSAIKFMLWRDFFKIPTFVNTAWLIPMLFFSIIVVFAVSFGIDLLRQNLLEKPIFNGLQKNKKISMTIQKVESLFPKTELTPLENNPPINLWYIISIVLLGFVGSTILSRYIDELNSYDIFTFYTIFVLLVYMIVKLILKKRKNKPTASNDTSIPTHPIEEDNNQENDNITTKKPYL